MQRGTGHGPQKLETPSEISKREVRKRMKKKLPTSTGEPTTVEATHALNEVSLAGYLQWRRQSQGCRPF